MPDIQINPSIFKAYDVRGIYPTELNEEIAYRFGRSYVEFISTETNNTPVSVGVSNDMRLSSPQLKGSLIHGLLDAGAIVYDIGFSSTPSFYFAIGYYKYDGGIQVSASHNPKEYNGFKVVRQNAIPISGDSGLNKIRDLIIQNKFISPLNNGIYRTIPSIVDTEVLALLKNADFTSIKPFKIAIDSANAISSLDLDCFFSHFPQLNLIKINFDLDGNFPNHEPDPLKDENLQVVQQAVIDNQADFGISPDGDGDRYFFIDNRGEIVRQEIIRGIMAQIAIKENPGATVCYDIRPGKITQDMIITAGGKASVTRVGHSLIKEQMLNEKAVFGGESSGHYFYKTSWGTFETPFLLLYKFMRYLTEQNKTLSEIVKPLKKYFHSGEINSVVSDTAQKLKDISQKYHDAELSFLDGITVTYPDYWFNVRPSNTEPKLRLNLEAISQEIMTSKRDEVLQFIRK